MKLISALISALSVSCVAAKVGTRGGRKSSSSIEHKPRFLKSSGKNGGGGDNPCSLCNGGRPETITLRYNVPAVDSPYHASSSGEVCGASSAYPASNTVSIDGSASVSISVGEEITITDPETWTQFDFGTGPDCEIHTSCSVDLIGDDQIGPWVIVPPTLCVPFDDCLICDNTDGNKNKPPSLTFEYIAGGKNSAYQPEGKATCREAMYPENTLIEAFTKDGDIIYSGTHSTGDIFAIDPSVSDTDFSAETTFTFSGMGDSCFIHTSCSVPLVQNDQIGPFKVLAGNDCVPGECVVANKDFYECGEDISVTFDYIQISEPKMGTDWVGIYPCDVVEYKHAESWLWACAEVTVGDNGLPKTTRCTNKTALDTAELTFTSPMPYYNDFGPHNFPIAPHYIDGPGSSVNNCFKAVLLRETGPSVPPYIEVCTSAPFTINNGTSAECQIRDSSFAYPVDP